MMRTQIQLLLKLYPQFAEKCSGMYEKCACLPWLDIIFEFFSSFFFYYIKLHILGEVSHLLTGKTRRKVQVPIVSQKCVSIMHPCLCTVGPKNIEF
jgi:hypothetical protein